MEFMLKNKKEVIKASAAIHISNNVNLMQRRSWNILLANAFNELEFQDEFTIRIKDLCDFLKYKGNNDFYIKQLVRDLQSVTVEWNLLGKDGNEWGRSVLLSGVIIKNGELTYAYDPILRKKLYNPSMYARINLSLQNKFRSKHSLALYELFIDYFVEKKSYGETPYILVDKFRKLLGLKENEYNKFKYLNDYIIKKSIKEINEKSDLFVEVKYIKNGRNIISLKFIIKKNPKSNIKLDVFVIPKKEQKVLPIEEFEIDNQELFIILTTEFGISKNRAINILKTTDEFYIQENLDVVRKGIKEGKIKNIPAYTVKALNEDFRSKKPKAQIEKEEKKKQLLKDEEEKQKMDELGDKIYRDFINEEINPEIKLLVSQLDDEGSLILKNWINKNPLYKRYKNEEDYFRFNVYQSYFKKNKELNNIDERFITFATNKGYKVKKTSDIIDKWIVIK